MENLIQSLFSETYIWVPKVSSALLIFIVFVVIAFVVKKAVKKAMQKMSIDNHLVKLLARLISITLIIIGLITALGTLGIDVSAIVAGRIPHLAYSGLASKKKSNTSSQIPVVFLL